MWVDGIVGIVSTVGISPRLSKAGWTRSGRGGWSRPRSVPIIGSYQPPRLRQLRRLRNIFLVAQPPRLRKAGIKTSL